MHTDKNAGSFKARVISDIMLGVKSFNEKHRSLAGVTTFFTLIFIALLSVILTFAEKVCSIFTDKGSFGKRAVGVLLAALVLFVVFKAGIFTKPAGEAEEKSVVQEPEVVETVVTASEAETAETSEIAEATEAPEAEPAVEETIVEEQEIAATEPEPETEKPQPTKEWDTSDVDLDAYIEEYSETVGWVYFEDGHISYPIMQTADNIKYKSKGIDGEDASTGAIFLDSRSSANFTDANSIVYGHNMKDHSMFGSLRDYREDPQLHFDQEYFQIITPDKKYRYQIFCYMDVPENYVIYDYVGEEALEFVKDAEPVRIKSYMDSEIPVNKDSKVVTLSTCTDKDDLQFVILGVMVDETE